MASNSTSVATLKSAHTAAEVGGVTFNTGAVLAPLGNATTWSRTSARAAYASGSITQSAFNQIMNALEVYEQVSYQSARDQEGSSGMLPY
jgi:hypothetical protein